MPSWALSLPERIKLLKLWVIPLMHTARAVYPHENVCSTLQLIYRVALKMGSWAVTQPTLC